MTQLALHDDVTIERFQALGEPTRLRILRCLAESEHCVCDLQDPLDAAQPRLSFHLRKLKDAGLVADRREGRWVHYRLVPEALVEMRALLDDLIPNGEGS